MVSKIDEEVLLKKSRVKNQNEKDALNNLFNWLFQQVDE